MYDNVLLWSQAPREIGMEEVRRIKRKFSIPNKEISVLGWRSVGMEI